MDKRKKIDSQQTNNDRKIKDRGDVKKVMEKPDKRNPDVTEASQVTLPEGDGSDRKLASKEKIKPPNIEKKKAEVDKSKVTPPVKQLNTIAKDQINVLVKQPNTNTKNQVNVPVKEPHITIKDQLIVPVKQLNTMKDQLGNVPTKQPISTIAKDLVKEKIKDAPQKTDDKIKYRDKLKNQSVTSTLIKRDTPQTNVLSKSNVSKNDSHPKKQIMSEIIHSKAKQNDSSNESRSETRESDKKTHRKPMIKTIMSKTDTMRIYKAVTFVDQKNVQPTPLQIKIPSDPPKTKLPKHNEINLKTRMKATVSRVSLKEKPVFRKRNDRKRRKSRHIPSPDPVIKNPSPPTEVAKWAPSCINQHTKPYYEAWVNTTLAAISRSSKKDKAFLEKQNILRTFKRALEERPATPDLVYENFADERYAGRIKVIQR